MVYYFHSFNFSQYPFQGSSAVWCIGLQKLQGQGLTILGGMDRLETLLLFITCVETTYSLNVHIVSNNEVLDLSWNLKFNQGVFFFVLNLKRQQFVWGFSFVLSLGLGGTQKFNIISNLPFQLLVHIRCPLHPLLPPPLFFLSLPVRASSKFIVFDLLELQHILNFLLSDVLEKT